MNKMNKMMNTANNSIVAMLRNSIPSIEKLHDACTRALDRDHEYYMANRSYNKYVVNGCHKPENLGEEIEYQLSLVHINNDIKRAYSKACWHNDEFQYPPKELVAAMMFRG